MSNSVIQPTSLPDYVFIIIIIKKIFTALAKIQPRYSYKLKKCVCACVRNACLCMRMLRLQESSLYTKMYFISQGNESSATFIYK